MPRRRSNILRRTVTFAVPVEILERLDLYIETTRAKRQDALETALAEYLDRKEAEGRIAVARMMGGSNV